MLFPDTIVCMDADADDGAVLDAARCAHKLIVGLPDGYDTFNGCDAFISPCAHTLSGSLRSALLWRGRSTANRSFPWRRPTARSSLRRNSPPTPTQTYAGQTVRVVSSTFARATTPEVRGVATRLSADRFDGRDQARSFYMA